MEDQKKEESLDKLDILDLQTDKSIVVDRENDACFKVCD